MTAHTPGPWNFDGPSHNIIVWSSSENRVCFLTSDGPAEGNARLIAAAPDMLSTLKALLPEIEDEVERRGDEDDNYDLPLAPALKKVRAVIALAEGRDG